MASLEDFRTGLLQYGGLRRFTRPMLIRCLQDGPQTARPRSLHSLPKDDLIRDVAAGLRCSRWESMAEAAMRVQRDREADIAIRDM